MLNFALGTQVQPIHYRGVAPAMNDLIAGQMDYMVDMSTTSIPQIQGSNVVPIAVMRSKRLSVLPDVSTSVEIWNCRSGHQHLECSDGPEEDPASDH